MKKLVSLAAIVIVCIAALVISASAAGIVAEGTCGTAVTWWLDDEGTLTITGPGSMKEYSGNKYPWYSHKNEIVRVVIEDGVRNVAPSAFSGLGGYWEIEEVIIPPSVTTIGKEAFQDCDGLTSVIFTGTSGLTTIGDKAFYTCSALEKFTVPASVTAIGARALAYNGKLAEVVFETGSKLTTIGDNAFELDSALKSVAIPASVVTINECAFRTCESLEKVTFAAGSKLTTIGNYAFQDCDKLENVTVPAGVTSIGKYAFRLYKYPADYTNSLDVTIPADSKLVSIGEFAFAGCMGKMDIHLPASLTTLGQWAFGYCPKLTDIYYGGSAANWSQLLTTGTNQLPDGVTLHYNCAVPPRITAQPKHQVASGGYAYFTVGAAGEGLKYQWQYSLNGVKWSNTTLTGHNTAKLRVAVTDGNNARRYRCVITGANGLTVTSSAAVLYKAPDVKITAQPKDQTAPGGYVYFTVGASGNGLKYQWQYRGASGGAWSNTTLTGCHTDTLRVGVSTTTNGRSYRCIVTDRYGRSVTSAAADLTKGVALKITSQPKDQVAPGGYVYFTVGASGDGVKYQWQYSLNGVKWDNTTLNGCNTNRLRVAATAANDGRRYRCIVTDANGSTATSKAAVLYRAADLKITAQPKDQVASGGYVYFTVGASGEGLSYQWQWKGTASDSRWDDTTLNGCNTNRLRVAATVGNDGRQYRCIVTDGFDREVVSASATLRKN